MVKAYANESTIIVGKIVNPDNKIVAIEYNHTLLDNSKTYYDKMDDNGNFRIEFNMDYPQDVKLIYGKDRLSLYLHPGDSTFISFKTNNIKNSIVIQGDNAKENIQLMNFQNGYAQLIKSERRREQATKLDSAEYILFNNRLFLMTDSLIISLNAGQEISGWMRNYAKFDYMEELYDYGKDHKYPYDDLYYNFFNESTTNLKSNLNCTQYSEFIGMYYYYRYDILNLYEQLKEYYKIADCYSVLLTILENFQDSLNFKTKCALAKELYFNIRIDVNSVDSISEKYFKVISNDMIFSIVSREIENYKTQKRKLYTLEELSKEDFIGDIFSEIKQKHLGKTIYIDGWQSCHNNYKRFPDAEKLRTELKDKEIAFVYLCTPDDNDFWIKNIEKYKIEGDNYLLSEDQKIVLYNLFNYESGTYNMIINKEGELVNIDANDPNSPNIKQELLEVIEQ